MAQNAKFEQIGNVKKNHIDSKKPKEKKKKKNDTAKER